MLRTQMTELLGLQNNKELRRVDQLSAVETTTVEVLIRTRLPDGGAQLGLDAAAAALWGLSAGGASAEPEHRPAA